VFGTDALKDRETPLWARVGRRSVRNLADDDFVLSRLLRAAADRHGDRTLLQFGALTRSFADVDRLTNSVANGLAALGV
jgi:hypothetical protein